MAKRRRKAKRFRVGDCVVAPAWHSNEVGRIVHRRGRAYSVKFWGAKTSTAFSRNQLSHRACTDFTPLAGAKRRRK